MAEQQQRLQTRQAAVNEAQARLDGLATALQRLEMEVKDARAEP
jgi:hypothetical protein